MRIRLAITGLLATAIPLLAHHSFSAEYEWKKPVVLSGVVTKIDWVNPHAHIFIDVRDAAGKVSNWELELGSPNVLQRMGWTRKSLKRGDEVVVHGFLAKDGSNLANARDVKLADGRKVSAGSSAGSGDE